MQQLSGSSGRGGTSTPATSFDWDRIEAKRSARCAADARLAEKMILVEPASPSSLSGWEEEEEEGADGAGAVPLPSLPVRLPVGLVLGVGFWGDVPWA